MIKEKLKRGSIYYKLYLFFDIFIRYKILKRNNKTFSQFGEDKYISNFFQNQKRGKYVDIGAFHPMRLSNTYLLYKKGWSGTNVDLNPISIDLFNLARSRDKNICTLIGGHNKISTNVYYENDWSSSNSIYQTKSSKAKGQMQMQLFNDIIEHNFDFLNIDLEGLDYEVLKTIDFKKFNPQLICIEILKDDLNKDNIFNHMKKNDYHFSKNFGPSFMFTK